MKSSHELSRTRELVPILCFGLAAIGSVLVLVGWKFDNPALKSVLPGFITMKANAAVGLFLFSLIGFLLRPRKQERARELFSHALAFFLISVVFTFSFATLAEYFFNRDLHIDEFFFLDPDAKMTLWPPGRPAPITAINFILLSIAALFNSFQNLKIRYLQQGLILFTLIFAFQGFIGYLAGVTHSFGTAFYTQIAIHTAFGFILLCVGFLSFSSDGFMRILSGDSVASTVGRSLLLRAVLIPPLINWLQIRGTQYGWWNADFGILLRVIINVGFFCWVAYETSSKLTQEEMKRSSAQARERDQFEKLARMEKRLHLITNAVPSFISYVDTNEHYLFVNSAYEDWFGMPPAEVIGKRMRDILGNGYEKAKASIAIVLSGSAVRYQNEVTNKNGKIRAFEADYIPDVGEDGLVRGFVIIGHDITERIRSETELREAIRTRDELLSVCSHELRTPITSMKLSVQMIKRGFENHDLSIMSIERVQRMIDQTHRQIERLEYLIEDMVDFSQINTGQLLLTWESFDLKRIFDDVVGSLRVHSKSVIHLSSNLSTDVQVIMDRLKIKQVLANLLSNAMKYGAGKPIVVSFGIEEDHLQFSVRDEGIGISESERGRIFQPYGRAVSVNHFSGLGIGLYIAREITAAHGGKIWFESEESSGSTFFVSLPLRPRTKTHASESSSPATGA